ncbi:MAG: acyltransferase, partial [Hyphomicrobiales bacterium]
MTYRSDIDGLRAIAVLAVIAFHIDAALLPGGFIGVDIFFVISGYLISKLIMEERSQGTFSLADFYERRIRRIFPALFFVVIVSGVFAALWMLPDEFDRFAKSVQANSLFLSNVHFWNEAGYFKAANEEKPLIHTWSIAIEEQFYLVFPVLLLLIARIKRLSLGLCVLVLSMLSLALAEWMSRHYFAANFYLLPGRAWEFGAGILCAVYGNQFQPKGLIRQAFSTAGLGLIIWSFVTFDSATPTPSLITLIPVAGTAMLIFFMKPGDWAARALAFGPMPAIGLLSYSLYLWHQPVFAFARIRSTSNITELGYLALVLLALGFSFLSWRFIERPFRDRSFLS